MEEVERRLTAALRERAELVTEESLRAEPPSPRRPRRWPLVVAAAAASVAAVASALVVTTHEEATTQLPATAPPSISTTTTPNGSTAPVLPPQTLASAQGSATTAVDATTQQPPPTCGGQPCTVVASADVGGDLVEVLAATDPTYGTWGDWQVRAGGVVVPGRPEFSSFVTDSSLRCAVVAGRPVCLVYTSYLGDSDTSVGLERSGGAWRFSGATFATPYGATQTEPRDLYDNGSIEVVSVEANYVDDRQLWTAQVWRWNGSRLGCTPRVDAPEKLPGWPTVTPDVPTLAIANCW